GGLVSSINSTRPDWFPQKKVVVPIVVALERSRVFPDVPAIAEFANDPRRRQVLELFVAPQAMDRPILAPPRVPSSRVELLRAATRGAVNAPRVFAKVAWKHIELPEGSGERSAVILTDASALPPDRLKPPAAVITFAGGRAGGQGKTPLPNSADTTA